MLTKREIRTEMRHRAAAFRDSDSESAACESIWSQVEAMPEFAAASRVLIYMSIPGEVETRGFIARWGESKQFVLPLVCGEHLELREYAPQWLVAGYRGIEEPSAEAPLVAPADVDLALIPGMAFARIPNGISPSSTSGIQAKVLRLGRGGGFYDRLLPQLSCPTVGLCYSYRLLETLPCDPWDAPLTRLITNN